MSSAAFAEEGGEGLGCSEQKRVKKSLDPHPEFHSSAPGTGGGREDRMGHFQQTGDLFVKASSHQPCLPPPPSPPLLTLRFINAVPLRLEGITSQETFQS